MAGNGPPPAENRRRRNADTYSEGQVVIAAPTVVEVRGPACASGTWLPATKEWYETWRRAPQAVVFVDTDWQRLRMLLPLVDRYYRRPSPIARLNESLLGATHVDRLKARIKVELAATTPAVPAGVTALDEYRDRLTG
jgi:hypothetical protein